MKKRKTAVIYAEFVDMYTEKTTTTNGCSAFFGFDLDGESEECEKMWHSFP